MNAISMSAETTNSHTLSPSPKRGASCCSHFLTGLGAHARRARRKRVPLCWRSYRAFSPAPRRRLPPPFRVSNLLRGAAPPACPQPVPPIRNVRHSSHAGRLPLGRLELLRPSANRFQNLIERWLLAVVQRGAVLEGCWGADPQRGGQWAGRLADSSAGPLGQPRRTVLAGPALVVAG